MEHPTGGDAVALAIDGGPSPSAAGFAVDRDGPSQSGDRPLASRDELLDRE